MRDHWLMITLSGIILLNIIAIILLQNRIVEQQESAVTARIAREQKIAEQNEPEPIQQTLSRPGVRTLILENYCKECFDIRQYLTALNDTVNMSVEVVLQEYLEVFNSTKLPAVAFNESFAQYSKLVTNWNEAGYTIVFSSGPYAGMWYVLPTLNAPYYDVQNNRIRGRVTVTYLTMNDCKECYDVYVNKKFLNGSKIQPYREYAFDISSIEGSTIVKKYNITKVPTIIMDDEALAYLNLQLSWEVVGTRESDGTHVLRDLERLNVVFYDLQGKKLMNP